MNGGPKKVFDSKDTLSRQELAELLETLAERIRSGTITLSSSTTTNQVELQLPESLTLEMQVEDSVKRSGTKRELELEIRWAVQDDGTPVEQPGPDRGFRIS